MKELHISLDLETLGTSADSAILSIGACPFQAEAYNPMVIDAFYVVVDLESNLRAGRKINAGTLQWWMTQNGPAREALFGEKVPRESLRNALDMFGCWAHALRRREGLNDDQVLYWGNGATFDNTLLVDASVKLYLGRPWHYHNDRDLRTIKDLYVRVTGAEPPKFTYGTYHHAKDDAVAQAMLIQHCLRKLQEPRA